MVAPTPPTGGSVTSLLKQTGVSAPTSFESMAFKGFRPDVNPANIGRAQTLNLNNQATKLGVGQVPTNPNQTRLGLQIQMVDLNNIPLLLASMPAIKTETIEDSVDRIKELAMEVFRQRGTGPGKAGNHIPGGRPVPWEVSPFTIKARKENRSAQPLLDTGQLVDGLEATLVPGPEGEPIAMLGMSSDIHEGTTGRENRKNGKSELQIAELMAILEEGSSNWKAGGFKWFARVGQAIQDPANDVVKTTAADVLTQVQLFANIDVQDALTIRATQRAGGAIAPIIRKDKPPTGAIVAASD